MESFVGFALAVLVCSAAAWLGMDRDRVFYPAVVMATASYYVVFAVIDGGRVALGSEAAIAIVFVGLAVLGFKRNPWLAVAALAGHGVLDVFHDTLVHNRGVPAAWPGFCLTFDLTAAALVVGLWAIRRRRPQGSRITADTSITRGSRTGSPPPNVNGAASRASAR